MKKFFIFIIFLIFGSILFAQDVTLLESYQSTIAVRVDIAQPWVNSGINLSQGDKIDIIAKGLATSDESHSNWWCGPEGLNYSNDTGLPMPDQPNQSLLAKVGENGTPFYVGRGISFISNIAGTLYFGYNDYGFTDNVGFYVAFVSGDAITTGMSFNERISEGPYYELSQNYPNPFNPNTKINFFINESQSVKLNIYDTNGELLRTLISGYLQKGSHTVTWDGKNETGNMVASGTYFYQIDGDSFIESKKMILLK